ncbi:hypothetical protein [Gracilibacillus sp. YIM 98692]|uniref:hypothetical protein n=1 Tax=Gracilibacillus sp. YIM 98692 TaxID=2663532 RepID=UPI0013D889AA|nr:hypothetical protein [Gracilibacillus sp. YIM 98692]
MTYLDLQVLGLILDIVGVVILSATYLDVSKKRLEQEWDEVNGYPELRKKERKITITGLVIIITGFVFQIIAAI